MAIEIELKAQIKDSEAIKSLLMEKTACLWAFEKEDTYWINESIPELPFSRLRVRREKLTFPEGNEKITYFVTIKTKELKDGIEINDETEFEISRQAERLESIFEKYILGLGMKPGISKKKRGWAFNHEGINAELTEVEGLGWFIELEILIEDNNGRNQEEIRDDSRKRLLNFLDSLGVEREAIESRFYAELLAKINLPPG